MVKRTYKLSDVDAERLLSLALRYTAISTSIDEENREMSVSTTWVNNPEPTSLGARFKLEVVSDEAPAMPKWEEDPRVKGVPYTGS
jgi:hypothetical protein